MSSWLSYKWEGRYSHGRVVNLPPGLGALVPFHSLHVELLQASLQPLQILLESFAFDLELRRRLCDAELLRVELDNVRSVVGAVVGGDGLGMVRRQCCKVAGEF